MTSDQSINGLGAKTEHIPPIETDHPRWENLEGEGGGEGRLSVQSPLTGKDNNVRIQRGSTQITRCDPSAEKRHTGG